MDSCAKCDCRSLPVRLRPEYTARQRGSRLISSMRRCHAACSPLLVCRMLSGCAPAMK
jgi:hypothetical protein